VAIVENQMLQMDTQLESLDKIISRVEAQNKFYHESHSNTLDRLSSTVKDSYADISNQLAGTSERMQHLRSDLSGSAHALGDTFSHFEPNSRIQSSLRLLREEFLNRYMAEYEPTGQTPIQTQYSYPTFLPTTRSYVSLLERFRGGLDLEVDDEFNPSPSKTRVFIDNDIHRQVPTHSGLDYNTGSPVSSLQELDVNRRGLENHPVSDAHTTSSKPTIPPLLKKQITIDHERLENSIPRKSRAPRMTVAGANVTSHDQENIKSADFSKSVGYATGRRLRSHGSQ
jgi:hypothetical protein